MQVRILPRTLHFKQPAGTSRGIYLQRHVWYVVVRYKHNGRTALGLGECAPLPDLSCDYSNDYEAKLRHACMALEQNGTLDQSALQDFPSIRFGLETALLSAQASLGTDSLELFPSPFSRGESGIRINGLVWMGSQEEMLERMEKKLEEGFHCVKLKIGAIDFEAEMQLIHTLRSRFSEESVELRVDANGAFKPADALGKLHRLAHYGIHSIEQPIRQGQWDAMQKLCKESPLPIALDEELIGINSLHMKQQLLDTIRPHYIVLKPSLHGGVSGCKEWIREAERRSIPYWITSALESNVGLNAIAQWAATLPPSPLAQGLGTGQLFVSNFEGTHLHIEGERLWRGDRQQRLFHQQVEAFRQEWLSPTDTITVHTSGSTGKPKAFNAQKSHMKASAELTCRILGLRPGTDSALLCLPLDYIAGKMQCLRALLWNLPLICIAPSSHPLSTLRHSPDFAAMTPMQVYESLKVPRERRLLRGIRHLLIGGGPISESLEKALRGSPNNVWSTYGMTETLSHIALRRLNGPHATDGYQPLPGVKVALDKTGHLLIQAPHVCTETLRTNDLAELHPNGTFRIIGRSDNIINSGGIKLQLETIEEKLANLRVPFILTSVADEKLGEKLVLLYAGTTDESEYIAKYCAMHLPPYERPKHYLAVHALPVTATGKPARTAAKRIAQQRLSIS